MPRIPICEKVLPLSFRRELDEILAQHNKKVFSKIKVIPRDCSTKTRYERAANIQRSFAELFQLGYHLRSPLHLKTKHLQVLAKYWQEKGLAPKTLHGLFSNLRGFCRWIGKNGMVEDVSVYCQGQDLVRPTAATIDLSWESRGVDVGKFIEEAKAFDLRFGLMLEFQRYFGLRVKESIELRPWRSIALGDDFLHVTSGTKGGKPRVVRIRSDHQRQIIATAKEFVGEKVNAQLRWHGRTWKQAQAHFYALMAKFGATKQGLGVSPHGLRHAFLQEEYQFFAGVPAPIKAADQLPESRLKHQLALQAVSLEAGHFRTQATGMYCGSLGHQLRGGSPKKEVHESNNYQPKDEYDENTHL